MKKNILIILTVTAIIITAASCNTKKEEFQETAKIPNTLQSVSYFQDTINIDPNELLTFFNEWNKAIDEIGYPDAGYKFWVIQEDTSNVNYMVEGHWPDQETYDKIHDHELYKKVYEENQDKFEGLVSIEYHRFKEIK